MNVMDLNQELSKNSYPGRSVVIGKSDDGKFAVVAYFIMGRSENSRNRIFEKFGDGIKTKAFDDSKLIDPSLIIYSPVRVYKNKTIITNGDQTDTIHDFINNGDTFEKALNTRTFEPDPPIFTPRISAMIELVDKTFSFKMSILKSDNGNENSVLRYFYNYETPITGQGRFIHTYECDGDPVPSFSGEPKIVAIGNDIDVFTNEIWDGLNEQNKVSLFTRFINLNDSTMQDRIINKNTNIKVFF